MFKFVSGVGYFVLVFFCCLSPTGVGVSYLSLYAGVFIVPGVTCADGWNPPRKFSFFRFAL